MAYTRYSIYAVARNKRDMDTHFQAKSAKTFVDSASNYPLKSQNKDVNRGSQTSTTLPPDVITSPLVHYPNGQSPSSGGDWRRQCLVGQRVVMSDWIVYTVWHVVLFHAKCSRSFLLNLRIGLVVKVDNPRWRNWVFRFLWVYNVWKIVCRPTYLLLYALSKSTTRCRAVTTVIIKLRWRILWQWHGDNRNGNRLRSVPRSTPMMQWSVSVGMSISQLT